MNFPKEANNATGEVTGEVSGEVSGEVVEVIKRIAIGFLDVLVLLAICYQIQALDL